MNAAIEALKTERKATQEAIRLHERRLKAIDRALAALAETELDDRAQPRHAPAPAAPLKRPRRSKHVPNAHNGMQASCMKAVGALSADRLVPVSPKGVARWLKKHGEQVESTALKTTLAGRAAASMALLAKKGMLVRTDAGLYDLPGRGTEGPAVLGMLSTT